MDSYFDFDRYERSETTGRRGILSMTTEAEANDTTGMGMGTQYAEADSASIDQMYLPAYTVAFEDGHWIVTYADGTGYITDTPPLPPPALAPAPLSPSLLSLLSSIPLPAEFNLTPSTVPATPEEAGPQDGPAATNDNFTTLDRDALSVFPDTYFQQGEQAAPADRRNNNNNGSGDVRHAPYPKTKPQAVAPSADLSAINTLSTGATLTGGALAGDAGGVASPHTSAAQVVIPRPVIYDPDDVGDEADRVCTYKNCVPSKPTKYGFWRKMPVFANADAAKRHMDSVHLGLGKKCPDCGDKSSRGDAAKRHRLTCKGKGKGKASSATHSKLPKHDDHDGSGFGGGSSAGMSQYASAQAGPSRLPY